MWQTVVGGGQWAADLQRTYALKAHDMVSFGRLPDEVDQERLEVRRVKSLFRSPAGQAGPDFDEHVATCSIVLESVRF